MDPQSGKRGFVFLNITQFFVAANDNILKQVLIFGLALGGIWENKFGEGAQAYASLCLAIPFVLFSGFAGQFADRFSKRDVCIVVKISEVFIALLAMIGFLQMNVWIVLVAMILISIQSTFFTPAKFGILPEIIEESELSRANGTINMFTYIAIILGAAIGGPIYGAYASDATDEGTMLWLPGVIIVLVAILGAAAAFGIPKLVAQNPSYQIKPTFFRTYIETWRDISGTALVPVLVSWSFFYMIVGGIAILILPDYKTLLDIDYTSAGLLMVALGISTGIGDFVAGRVSGHQIRPGLIPIGGICTAIMFTVTALIPLNFYLVLVCLSLAGFMAGFVMVPLQTMTQQFSPEEERGRIIGLWNCLSFVGIIIGNLLFLAIKSTGVPSNLVFLLCGFLGLLFVVMYYWRWKKVFARAVVEIHMGKNVKSKND